MNNTNQIIINGNQFSFEQGETILNIARRNNIEIPTLCELKGALPTGACRICVVQIKGAKALMTACSTPAANGMDVMTESPDVVSSRKETLNLLHLLENTQNFVKINRFIYTVKMVKNRKESQKN